MLDPTELIQPDVVAPAGPLIANLTPPAPEHLQANVITKYFVSEAPIEKEIPVASPMVELVVVMLDEMPVIVALDVPLLAAVMSPLPLTVIVALVYVPTLLLTVASVPAPVTFPDPSSAPDV